MEEKWRKLSCLSSYVILKIFYFYNFILLVKFIKNLFFIFILVNICYDKEIYQYIIY